MGHGYKALVFLFLTALIQAQLSSCSSASHEDNDETLRGISDAKARIMDEIKAKTAKMETLRKEKQGILKQAMVWYLTKMTELKNEFQGDTAEYSDIEDRTQALMEKKRQKDEEARGKAAGMEKHIKYLQREIVQLRRELRKA